MDAKDTIVRLRARVRELSLSLHPASVIEQVLLEEADTLIIALCAERDAAVESCDEARVERDEAVKEAAMWKNDYETTRHRLDAALDDLRCPECGCGDQVDAESQECGCDAPVCARDGGKTLAQAYIDSQAALKEIENYEPDNEMGRDWNIANLQAIASAAVKGGEEKAT